MTWKEYQGILGKDKLRFNNAVSGGDMSVDPSPSKDPNNFLAPLASGSGMQVAGIIIAYLVIVYLVIVIAGKLHYKIPSL